MYLPEREGALFTKPARQPDVHSSRNPLVIFTVMLYSLCHVTTVLSNNCLPCLFTGFGKRRGTANARLPFKILWMRRQRVLRRLLKKMRDAKKIDRHIYHSLYILAKGNQFKNKRVLMETIHDMKAIKNKETALKEQADARKGRAAARLARRAEKEAKKQQEQESAAAASN